MIKSSLYFYSLLLLFCSNIAFANVSKSSVDALLQQAQQATETKNYQQAFSFYLQAAEQYQDPLATVSVANYYQYGIGMTPNSALACIWYKKSALHKTPIALDFAAQCLLAEQNSSENVSKAIEYFELAATSGHHISWCNLADLYFSGELVKKDIPKAISLCERSALQSSPVAMLRVGNMYLKSDQEADRNTGANWILHAAEINHFPAQYRLAELYEQGISTEASLYGALNWYEKAASNGYQPAYAKVAEIYFNSPKDAETGLWQEAALAKAYMWLSASVKTNKVEVEKAQLQTMLTEVTNEMPPSWQSSLDKKVRAHFDAINNKSDK